MEELLDTILELIGLLLANVLEPRSVVGELGLAHGGFEHGIVDAIELEHEEQEMRGRRCEAVLHIAIELGAGGIDRVAGMHEACKRGEPAQQIVELLIAHDRLRKRNPAVGLIKQRRQLAFEVVLERLAILVGAVEIAFHLRVVNPGIKVVEIPFGQIAELFRDGGFLGSSALGRCGHDSINELERAVIVTNRQRETDAAFVRI